MLSLRFVSSMARNFVKTVPYKVLAISGCLLGVGAGSLFPSAMAREVTDITGHVVQVPDHPKRIVLGEGRLIYALEPLEGKDLFKRVVGWQGEFKGADTQNYQEMLKIFPEAANVAVIGKTSADTISPEKILELHPDLAIFSTTGHGPGQSGGIVERLATAHIPVIFVDFRQDPVHNTVPSMKIIGKALERDTEAENYGKFYEERLAYIENKIKDIPQDKRPRVFIDMLAGARSSCCHTSGHGNMGSFIEVAGGINLASALLPSYLGDISAEELITLNPDILILDGTKGPSTSAGPGLKMGGQVTESLARSSLISLLKAPELQGLKAVKEGKTYGIWHSFYDSPFNILAIEVMAKWFYPEKFTDLDPEADRRQIQSQFTSLPVTGTYWVSEKPEVAQKVNNAQ